MEINSGFKGLIQIPPPQFHHTVMVKTPLSFCLKQNYTGIRFPSLHLDTNQHIQEGRLATD